MIEKFTLENGLTVLTKEIHHAPVCQPLDLVSRWIP